eukprot:SAG25_NODE_10047_length_347_cov_1.217742_1_plen_65_part_01
MLPRLAKLPSVLLLPCGQWAGSVFEQRLRDRLNIASSVAAQQPADDLAWSSMMLGGVTLQPATQA